MTATITKLTGSARTASTVEKRNNRLEATKVRLAERKQNARIRVEKAEEALKKAHERLARAKAKVVRVDEYAVALVEKQTTELSAAEKFHEVTVKREQERVVRVTKVKTTTPAGTVEAADGKVHPLTAETVETIKSVLGRRRKGVLTTKSGDEGKVIDAIARDIEPDLLGELFQVSLKGRKTAILFAIEKGVVSFETESK